MTEVSVIRDRLDTVEHLLDRQTSITRADIENYRPGRRGRGQARGVARRLRETRAADACPTRPPRLRGGAMDAIEIVGDPLSVIELPVEPATPETIAPFGELVGGAAFPADPADRLL